MGRIARMGCRAAGWALFGASLVLFALGGERGRA